MRYVVLLRASQPQEPPPAELMEGIMELGEQATKAGALIDNAGLSPSAAGARINLTGGELSVMDGPFTEAKELISYAVYEVASKQEAIEWTNRFMVLHADLWPGWEGSADVLKVLGPEDFGPPAG